MMILYVRRRPPISILTTCVSKYRDKNLIFIYIKEEDSYEI